MVGEAHLGGDVHRRQPFPLGDIGIKELRIDRIRPGIGDDEANLAGPRCGYGLVYAAAAAFGFATVEAIGYSLLAAFAPLELAVDAGSSALAAGLAMAVLRGLITGPAHALWSCVWGYPLGVLRTGGGAAWRWRLLAGFGIAVAGHGMFNALSIEQNPAALGAMVALVIGGLILVRLQFRRMTG